MDSTQSPVLCSLEPTLEIRSSTAMAHGTTADEPDNCRHSPSRYEVACGRSANSRQTGRSRYAFHAIASAEEGVTGHRVIGARRGADYETEIASRPITHCSMCAAARMDMIRMRTSWRNSRPIEATSIASPRIIAPCTGTAAHVWVAPVPGARLQRDSSGACILQHCRRGGNGFRRSAVGARITGALRSALPALS